MGLTTRDLQSQLATQDPAHIWEVKIPNHPNGVKQMQCGNRKDADRLLEIYPDATISKVFLPPPPNTVNVSAQNLGSEEALNEGKKSLPYSEQLPLDL